MQQVQVIVAPNVSTSIGASLTGTTVVTSASIPISRGVTYKLIFAFLKFFAHDAAASTKLLLNAARLDLALEGAPANPLINVPIVLPPFNNNAPGFVLTTFNISASWADAVGLMLPQSLPAGGQVTGIHMVGAVNATNLDGAGAHALDAMLSFGVGIE